MRMICLVMCQVSVRSRYNITCSTIVVHFIRHRPFFYFFLFFLYIYIFLSWLPTNKIWPMIFLLIAQGGSTMQGISG